MITLKNLKTIRTLIYQGCKKKRAKKRDKKSVKKEPDGMNGLIEDMPF